MKNTKKDNKKQIIITKGWEIQWIGIESSIRNYPGDRLRNKK